MSYIYFRKDGSEYKSDQYDKVLDYVRKDYPEARPTDISILNGNDHTRFCQASRLVAVIWLESVTKA
jgi:hypothetical protein